MKIRTDFVTNSSSGCFVAYTFDRKMFDECMKMLGMPPMPESEQKRSCTEFFKKGIFLFPDNTQRVRLSGGIYGRWEAPELMYLVTDAYVDWDLIDEKTFEQYVKETWGRYEDEDGNEHDYRYPGGTSVDYRSYSFKNKYIDGDDPRESAESARRVIRELFLETDFESRLMEMPTSARYFESGGSECPMADAVLTEGGRTVKYKYLPVVYSHGFEDDDDLCSVSYANGTTLLKDAYIDGILTTQGEDSSIYEDSKVLEVHRTKCREIIAEEGVQTINFSGCTELEKITLPDSLRFIVDSEEIIDQLQEIKITHSETGTESVFSPKENWRAAIPGLTTLQVVIGDIKEISNVSADVSACIVISGWSKEDYFRYCEIIKDSGPKLLEEFQSLGGITEGEVLVTKGHLLPFDYIIHYLVLDWDSYDVRTCIEKIFAAIFEYNIRSITFCEDYYEEVIREIKNFLIDHPGVFQEVSFHSDYDHDKAIIEKWLTDPDLNLEKEFINWGPSYSNQIRRVTTDEIQND